jgi:exo-1,4-beta-D-glucosaminidase
MFEAYARNKYTSTGVIQWMLNNAWPSMIWHLYDYFLRPGGGYYGTKKACEPLHVQYSYDDRSVVVVNDTQQAFGDLRVSAELLNLDLSSRFERAVAVHVPADSVARAFVVPKPGGLSTTYLLRLRLEDAAGKLLSANLYWLSTREDVLDWPKTEWYYTPTKVHADLTGLARLPTTTLALAAQAEGDRAEGRVRVQVENMGAALAFQVHLRLVDATTREELLPVYWEDNYFALFPGERRELTVGYPRETGAVALAVEADAWNAARIAVGARP